MSADRSLWPSEHIARSARSVGSRCQPWQADSRPLADGDEASPGIFPLFTELRLASQCRAFGLAEVMRR
jgi:hypothetical protein